MNKEIIIANLEDLEKIYRKIVVETERSKLKNQPNDEEKLNQKQAAAFLGITEATIIKWKHAGRIPCLQLPNSKKVTYFKSELLTVLQRNPELLQPPRK
jgi:Helix-turn-helix domain